MRDFLPADVRRREYVIGVIKEVYERYGFEPLETPAVENIETLMGKYGEEGNQLIFKILKRGVHEATGEADLALRYDLTVPLARVVAEYREKLPKFFKRYQIQPVWRADRPARGRFREFYQCDVDVLGSKSMVVEAELIAAASDALVALGFDDFEIRLNHRKVLTGILNSAGVATQKQNELLVALDKLDRVGVREFVSEIAERDIASEPVVRILGLLESIERLRIEHSEHNTEMYKKRHGLILQISRIAEALSPGESLKVQIKDPLTADVDTREMTSQNIAHRLSGFMPGDEDGGRGLADLKSIITLTKGTTAENRIVIDPSLARGLSYYTGAIMEITAPSLSGSLGGGGRYDNLVGTFSRDEVPACGFSLGLERIIVVMTEREMFPPQLVSSPADVMVSIWNEESIADSVALAQELRSGGSDLRVDLYPEADKLGKQFKYAAAREIPFVAVVGDDERARGEVAIKDMRSGEQRTVKRADAAMAIRHHLDLGQKESG